MAYRKLSIGIIYLSTSGASICFYKHIPILQQHAIQNSAIVIENTYYSSYYPISYSSKTLLLLQATYLLYRSSIPGLSRRVRCDPMSTSPEVRLGKFITKRRATMPPLEPHAVLDCTPPIIFKQYLYSIGVIIKRCDNH